MLLKIAHTTTYKYSHPVQYALQQVRLTPSDNALQTIINWSVDITGGENELSFLDQHENCTLLVNVESGRNEVTVRAHGEVETSNTSGILGKIYGALPLWYFQKPTYRTRAGKQVVDFASQIVTGLGQLDSLHKLSNAIRAATPFDTTKTDIDTTAEEAISLGGGVCQDHAQIFVACARHAGIPARYVSGYLMINDQIDQEASHAWAEVHLDDIGWVGFDVSNGVAPDEKYVRLATALDSAGAAPISGMRFGSSKESMIVTLQVQQ